MFNDVLFELGTEELPSGAVWPLVDALANHVVAALEKAKLQHGTVYRFATPRRLAIVIHRVQSVQDSQRVSRRGPSCLSSIDAAGQPLPSLLGFAKSCGVTVDDLTQVETDKGAWWVYEALHPGVKTEQLLPAMIRDAVMALPIIKPMRWGTGTEPFVRPVHWAVLLFGDEVVDMMLLGVRTGRTSFGHRFHHPAALEISTPRAYASSLQDAFVLADFHVRRQVIIDQIQALTSQRGCQAIMPEALLDEVTSIVEWPEALLAHFDAEFLDVPPEALIASMQSHQKCFALRDQKGQLLPLFITISNIVSHHKAQVIKGNEKVMRARLSDAAFFYRQDQQQALSFRYADTANVVFQERLGSLQEKVTRIQEIMKVLVPLLALEKNDASRAAYLSKCDLLTGMVGEFPELQGLMGSYYARHDGETEAVAQALHEQYMPRFSTDQLPQSPLGLALSLADRLDTLVGGFAMGQKPSGVKDPFKLRRHALAVARLLMSTPAELRLSTLIDETFRSYGDRLQPIHRTMLLELQPFILERLPSFYQAAGVAQPIVQAVFARQADWLFDMDQRVRALQRFLDRPEAMSLSSVCKRVTNLLQQVDESFVAQAAIDTALLVEPAEQSLFDQVIIVEDNIDALYRSGDYSNILNQLAALHTPVSVFFEQVMVMAEDSAIKVNRLALLARLQNVLKGVADLSLL
jgi:glycyl-tRNA synthetase beta chain